MDRKATARETLTIMEQGYYQYEGQKMDIQSDMDASIRASFLITPERGAALLQKYNKVERTEIHEERVENLSTVDAIQKLAKEGRDNIGVMPPGSPPAPSRH